MRFWGIFRPRAAGTDADAARAHAAGEAIAGLPRNGSPKWFGHWEIRRDGTAVRLRMNKSGSAGDPETARQLDSLVSAIAGARGDER
jgi:hypothetical protein